jgi:hypothetical protein
LYSTAGAEGASGAAPASLLHAVVSFETIAPSHATEGQFLRT